jgi:hypothetical protein
MLAAITLFCYSASLAALCALGYSLVMLALSVAAQQILVTYSPPGT